MSEYELSIVSIVKLYQHISTQFYSDGGCKKNQGNPSIFDPMMMPWRTPMGGVPPVRRLSDSGDFRNITSKICRMG